MADQPTVIHVGSKPWAVAINEQTRGLYSAIEFENTECVLEPALIIVP